MALAPIGGIFGQRSLIRALSSTYKQRFPADEPKHGMMVLCVLVEPCISVGGSYFATWVETGCEVCDGDLVGCRWGSVYVGEGGHDVGVTGRGDFTD